MITSGTIDAKVIYILPVLLAYSHVVWSFFFFLYAKAFGGDKNQITIFGGSAGSSSVNFHILSELSRGFFNQAILQVIISTIIKNNPLRKNRVLHIQCGVYFPICIIPVRHYNFKFMNFNLTEWNGNR